MTRPGDKLIFVLGVHSRTGTNLLRGLLSQHNACVVPAIHEDYFLRESEHLVKFASGINHGKQTWLPESETLRTLGFALEDYLWEGCTRKEHGVYVLAKTPSTVGLENLDKLFPGAKVVMIYRDPRDVAVSAHLSFARPYMTVAEDWKAGVQRMFAFLETHPNAVRVQYEQLVRNRTNTMQSVFTQLRMDWMNNVNWPGIMAYPIHGSSDLIREGHELHWKPVRMHGNFNPIGRWHHWSSELLHAFQAVVQPELSMLGYKVAD
jgi:hypothetical protein